MSEFKIGDIVRMKPEQGWILGVRQYLGVPLVVQGTSRDHPLHFHLSDLDGERLNNPDNGKAWQFHQDNLELDPFLNAVRKRRHV